ncbi:MAG: VCBS repeat-containing protein [Paracoccaceae bacterium]
MLRGGVLAALLATSASAEGITTARYTDPTPRYDHGILGDAIEWGALEMTSDQGRRLRVTLPDTRVFEDTEPRVVDLDGDGAAEVITVETDLAKGARLVIYGPKGLIAATPHIGATHRWLAPIGAADLDGDGFTELAYVDRPHLAKTIRVWRFRNAALTHVADLPGFTNHRIGEDNIAGGIRTCTGPPEMIVADANWSQIHAVTYTNGRFQARALGPHQNRASFAAAMACKP